MSNDITLLNNMLLRNTNYLFGGYNFNLRNMCNFFQNSDNVYENSSAVSYKSNTTINEHFNRSQVFIILHL